MNGLFFLMAKLVAFNASRLYFTIKKKSIKIVYKWNIGTE